VFSVGRDTGELIVVKDLSNLEQNKQHLLIVEARDMGKEGVILQFIYCTHDTYG